MNVCVGEIPISERVFCAPNRTVYATPRRQCLTKKHVDHKNEGTVYLAALEPARSTRNAPASSAQTGYRRMFNTIELGIGCGPFPRRLAPQIQQASHAIIDRDVCLHITFKLG